MKFWCTLNEPWCVAFLGYRDGVHAPGITDEKAALAAVHHQLLAHGLAIRTLRSGGEAVKIGPALNLVSEVPASQSPADIAATRRLDGMENRLFLDPLLRAEYPKDVIEYYQSITDFAFIKDEDLKAISGKIDFLGVNYYEQHVTRAIAGDNRRDAACSEFRKQETCVHLSW